MFLPTEILKTQYHEHLERTERFRAIMLRELNRLMEEAKVTLGFPLEGRVKTWRSVEEKLARKHYELSDIRELDDLVGIRIVLLFRHDLDTVEKLILQSFQILRNEDTGDRLGEAQFGYQSQHYVLKLPAAELTHPDMADLGDMKVELQVRTLAQHIWAAASHKLQYKREASVPPPLKRTINRVSALLEIVDLEFERVLSEKSDYRETGVLSTSGTEPLNVDLLESVLADIFPAGNRREGDEMEELLEEIKSLEIYNVDDLTDILIRQRELVLETDKKIVEAKRASGSYEGTTKERIDQGVFYTHAGLTRRALKIEYGDKAEEVIDAS